MKDINNFVTTNFNDNIDYIEKNHPQLFSKLVSLDNAIANGHYKEKYELIYENNSFDVLEKATDNLLYDGKSDLHTKATLNNIDYNLQHDTFETFNEKNISDEDAVKYDSIEPFTHRLYGIGKIINFTQKKSLQKKELKYIYKYIFFGAGLGLHIEAVHNHIKSKIYLIIEDDLELFRLSLFTVNYKKISKVSKIVFSVFEDKEEFSQRASNFLEEEYYYNHYIKFFRMLSHSDEKISLFQSAILQQPHLGFHHSNLLLQYLKGIGYLNDYSFLNRTIKFDDKIFTEKPFLILAAGPSLQKEKKWLKEHQNDFTIVAVAATLSFLYNENIKPDIVVQVDAYEASQKHFSDPIYEFIKDAVYIFSAKVPASITSQLNKEQLFFFESGTNYKELSLKPSSPCAGSTTYQLSLLFGVKNIYLLGLDLALDNATGKTHIDTHVNARSVNPERDTYQHKTHEVEGNFQKTVSTLLLFKSSITAIDYSTKMLKQENQKIYNLSDGAKFFNTISQPIKDLTMQSSSEKTALKNHILSICKNNSSRGLNETDLANIKNKLSHALELKKIIESNKNKKYKKDSDYLQKLITFTSSITDDKLLIKYELTKVLDIYFRRVLPYIFDYFNTQKKHDKEEIMTINELLSDHLLKIVEYYYKAVESIITNERYE